MIHILEKSAYIQSCPNGKNAACPDTSTGFNVSEVQLFTLLTRFWWWSACSCLSLLFPKKKSAENWAEPRSKVHAGGIGGKKSAPGEQGSPESGSRDMVVSPSPKDGEAST